MSCDPSAKLIDALTVTTMLDLHDVDLLHHWEALDVGFPKALRTGRGPRWARAEVEGWARVWGWAL